MLFHDKNINRFLLYNFLNGVRGHQICTFLHESEGAKGRLTVGKVTLSVDLIKKRREILFLELSAHAQMSFYIFLVYQK